MAKPIFVLGSNRNGTTWLSNIISSHPQVSAVQHKAHWGIKENNMYRNMKYWEDLSEFENLISFLSLYGSGDYFKAAKGNREYFYRYEPDSFVDFFFELMDRMARKEKSKFWLTKFDTHFYSRKDLMGEFIERTKDRYENIFLVSIERNLSDVLESYSNMQGGTGRVLSNSILREIGIVLKTARQVSNYRSIDELHQSEGGLKVDFDDLKQDRRAVVSEIVNYLDLPFEDQPLTDQYPSNSSFRAQDTENRVPDWEIRFAEQWLSDLFGALPLLPRLLIRFRDTLRTAECPISWRLLKLKHMPERLKYELEMSDRRGLKSVLFRDE